MPSPPCRRAALQRSRSTPRPRCTRAPRRGRLRSDRRRWSPRRSTPRGLRRSRERASEGGSAWRIASARKTTPQTLGSRAQRTDSPMHLTTPNRCLPSRRRQLRVECRRGTWHPMVRDGKGSFTVGRRNLLRGAVVLAAPLSPALAGCSDGRCARVRALQARHRERQSAPRRHHPLDARDRRRRRARSTPSGRSPRTPR